MTLQHDAPEGGAVQPVAYMVDCGDAGWGWDVRLWRAKRKAEAEGCARVFGVECVPLYLAPAQRGTGAVLLRPASRTGRLLAVSEHRDGPRGRDKARWSVLRHPALPPPWRPRPDPRLRPQGWWMRCGLRS